MPSPSADSRSVTKDFIREIVAEDLSARKDGGRVLTRFPPEPNGYLHVGHAKSICLNFGIAEEHGSRCNLRFDDTNPTTEDRSDVQSIQADVRWLGFGLGRRPLLRLGLLCEQLCWYASALIRAGKA